MKTATFKTGFNCKGELVTRITVAKCTLTYVQNQDDTVQIGIKDQYKNSTTVFKDVTAVELSQIINDFTSAPGPTYDKIFGAWIDEQNAKYQPKGRFIQ